MASDLESDNSSEEKVFSDPKLVKKILRKLPPNEILKCRGVNKKMWKDPAEKLLLEKNGSNLDIGYSLGASQSEYVGLPIESVAQMAFLQLNVMGTWFRNTDRIKEFLNDKDKFSENPFPSKTVIFCMEYSREKLSKECEASLAEFVSRFKTNIWHCFVVFHDINHIDRIYSFLDKIMQLKHLKLLDIFNNWWPMIWDLERFKNLPRLEELTNLQIGGYRYETCFANLFLRGRGADSIQELRLSGIPSDSFECSNRLPNLKKLYLNQMRQIPFKPSASSFGQLEHLYISFDLTKLEYSPLLPVLEWADLCHHKTLQKLSLKGEMFRKLRRMDCRKTVQVQYPNMNEVAISYQLLRQASGVLPLFADKFPKWEKIHIYGFEDTPPDEFRLPQLGFEREESSDRKGNQPEPSNTAAPAFRQLCQAMFPYLPQSVTIITTDSGQKTIRVQKHSP